jgi:pilus assembly protein CpaE
MDRPRILLAVSNDAEGYSEALIRAGFEVVPADVSSVASAELAVLDCDLGEATLLPVATTLAAASVRSLLLVGEQSEIPAGVGGAGDEIALKPLPADALVYRLQALLIRAGRALPTESGAWADNESMSTSPIAGEGHVVSVFAPKGGVGKTTVSVNVAVALRQQTRAEVLLFDADVGVGNVTAVLDVPYRMGLVDLADTPAEEWSDAAFEHIVAVHPDTGVKVLTWGSDPADSEHVGVELLLAALRWARNHHSYVIVDNHPGYDDRTMAMLAVAHEIFLVVTPEVGAVRNSAQFLELARELGLGSVVRVIVNRANHGIRMTDLETTLGLPIAATIVSNGPKSVIASNEGRPIVTKFPSEKISNDLHSVARLISSPGPAPVAAPAKGRRWWMRLAARATEA